MKQSMLCGLGGLVGKTLALAAVTAGLWLAATGAVSAAAPSHPGQPARRSQQASPLVGVWMRQMPDGTFQGFKFEEDGSFVLAILDRHGDIVDTLTGTYTYAGGVLTLTYDGQDHTVPVIPLGPATIAVGPDHDVFTRV